MRASILTRNPEQYVLVDLRGPLYVLTPRGAWDTADADIRQKIQTIVAGVCRLCSLPLDRNVVLSCPRNHKCESCRKSKGTIYFDQSWWCATCWGGEAIGT